MLVDAGGGVVEPMVAQLSKEIFLFILNKLSFFIYK